VTLKIGFRKPPVILKNVLKAGHECTPEKITNESDVKPGKFDAAFGTIFKISTFFQRSKQIFLFFFFLNKAGYKLKNRLRLYRK
jgi:hypothetical protein